MQTLHLFIVRACEPHSSRYWTLTGPGVTPKRYVSTDGAWEQAIKKLRQAGSGFATLYNESGGLEWMVRRGQARQGGLEAGGRLAYAAAAAAPSQPNGPRHPRRRQ